MPESSSRPEEERSREARLNRRELLAASAAGAVVASGGGRAVAARAKPPRNLDFSRLDPGRGWPHWRCAGAANLSRSGHTGLLEAGTDVFPCDPRPVAFAVDNRFRDGEVEAIVESGGAGGGVVVRRTKHGFYYAAIVDTEQEALLIVRRLGTELDELARVPVGPQSEFGLTLASKGVGPTRLKATLETAGGPIQLEATDSARQLQRGGDPGVLATARTLFPSEGPPPVPALGNVRLLPYGVQEGQVVIGSPIGEALLGQIRERSTAVFTRIQIRSAKRLRPTVPSVVAATTAGPTRDGVQLQIATDLPTRVEVITATDRALREGRRVTRIDTGGFDAATVEIPSRGGERVYWRARVQRRGRKRRGSVRSFRPLPRAGSHDEATIAIGSCASQFGPIFDRIAAAAPDVFVWQGDLNYPDTMGPLAQTTAGYAGIWRDFMANPRMEEIFARTAFAAQRDDHDYGVQDANSENLTPWGLRPWEALVEPRNYYRFEAGLAEFWVLDQRLHKSDPDEPDTREKTLLGMKQRRWLLRTLASSNAPFKVICSPCTLAPLRANSRDGSWAAGFEAERDLILSEIADRVSGRTIFVTGDTHWTLVYERDGLFEARPCPLGIPTPNDITLSDPLAAETARTSPGVEYSNDDEGHFAKLRVSGSGQRANLELSLIREDGVVAYQRLFAEPVGA